MHYSIPLSVCNHLKKQVNKQIFSCSFTSSSAACLCWEKTTISEDGGRGRNDPGKYLKAIKVK